VRHVCVIFSGRIRGIKRACLESINPSPDVPYVLQYYSLHKMPRRSLAYSTMLMCAQRPGWLHFCWTQLSGSSLITSTYSFSLAAGSIWRIAKEESEATRPFQLRFLGFANKDVCPGTRGESDSAETRFGTCSMSANIDGLGEIRLPSPCVASNYLLTVSSEALVVLVPTYV